MDLLKGLTKTILLIAAIISICLIASIIVYTNLSDRVAQAYEQGYKEGQAEGYSTGRQEGSRAGYQKGSKTGYSIASQGYYSGNQGKDFYFVYNPTYQEVQEILAGSNAHSASELHEYAEANGIRIAYVRCQIAFETTEDPVYVYHLVAFETVDRGFIIIEPWSYQEVKLATGKSYSEMNGLPPPGYDDTIVQVRTIW